MEASEILEKYRIYLTEEKCMAARSVRDYTSVAEELSKRHDLTGPLSFKQVNDSIAELKNKLSWSQGTTYKYSVCTRHLFRFLITREFRYDNPYPFSDWKKPRPSTPRFLTTEQFEQIVDDPFLSHQELTLLWLLWDSGARIGEIEQLNQSNIDLEKGIVNIPYEISKGKYSYRNVPISEKCVTLLKDQFGFVQRRGHNDAIFLNAQNERMTRSGMQKIIHNIGERQSPLRPRMELSPHAFRHSCAVRWLSQKLPELIVMKWLGHHDLSMTARYTNLNANLSREVYEKFALA